MLAFTSTCVHLYADASKSARQGSRKCFCKKLFGIRRASGISSVFYVSKPTPIKHHDFYSCASEKEAFSFVLACFASLGTRFARLFTFAKLPTQAWSPTLVKAQQTGFPKMFLKKTFWDVLIARFFRFFYVPKVSTYQTAWRNPVPIPTRRIKYIF